MARFEKGDQFVEYWTERPERPLDPATGRPEHAWPELLSRSGFPALNRLGFFECSLTPAGMATLSGAGYPVDPTAISPAESWREPEQKPGRYCSVSE